MYKKYGSNNFYRDVITPHSVKRSNSTISRVSLEKKRFVGEKKKGCCS